MLRHGSNQTSKFLGRAAIQFTELLWLDLIELNYSMIRDHVTHGFYLLFMPINEIEIWWHFSCFI
jgi:hypothetical protein